MTESEWLTCEDARDMIMLGTETPGMVSTDTRLISVGDRKMRLICCALARSTVGSMARLPCWLEEWEDDDEHVLDNLYVTCATHSWVRVCPTVAPGILRDIIGNPWLPGNRQIIKRAWLTDTVGAIAQQAYDERPGRKCRMCKGHPQCAICNGTGRIEDGKLDAGTLGVLADALIDAGCPEMVESPTPTKVIAGNTCPACGQEFDHMKKCCRGDCGRVWIPGAEELMRLSHQHPIITALRSPGPKYRGFWCIDTILGLE